MTTVEDQLRTVLRAQAEALRVPERPALDRDIVHHPRRPGPRWAIAAACLALSVAGVVSLTQRNTDDPASVVSGVSDTTAPVPATNGWVAVVVGDSDGDHINLVRPGQDPHPLEIPRSDTAAEACPAWSPDGTRPMFGRLTGLSDTTPGDAQLVIVPVSPDGAAGTPTVIALDGFSVLEGFDPHPCATWASDGRRVALRGPGEVWVVDTQDGAIRRLPNLRPVDLEWRPGTDELAIAGDMGLTRADEWQSTPVTIYSVSTGELRHLGSVESGHISWSPDGSTLAYEGLDDDEDDPEGLWLVDADGNNERLLIAGRGRANHGIGPVWSPTGDRIAYQRLCCQRAETHEVVLVSVADGTETVIKPPKDDGPVQGVVWYPFNVTWSPDGRTLLYTAWRSGQSSGPPQPIVDARAHVITVSADVPRDATVLTIGSASNDSNHQWIQMWGRQPG